MKTTGSNRSRLSNIENHLQKLEKKYDDHIIAHIVEDLDCETFTNSGRYMYTYNDLAQKYNTSASTISRIAEEHGLSRRNKSIIS